MTAREVYEAVLIELNKTNAPNILLEDFNYFFNKTIYQYINKRYNIYDVNQQTTDDLRVLKSTAFLDVVKTPYKDKINIPDDLQQYNFKFMDATYTVNLPDDYFHLLNCECFFKVLSPFKCYNQNDIFRAQATRLTADAWSEVVDNFYFKPTYRRPYFYIHNVNTSTEVPTNPISSITDENNRTIENTGTDKTTLIDGGQKGLPGGEGAINKSKTSEEFNSIEGTIDPFKVIDINGYGINGNYEQYALRNTQIRYGNPSKVLMEIRYGQDTSTFELVKVMVDYIKTPQHIRLTQDQLDVTLDKSQTLEFPDYVCQEIINELVHVIMENIMDQRIQTHPIVTQSIANPVQQQTAQ